VTPRFPRTAADRGKIAPARFAHCVVRTTTEHYAELVDWYRTLLEAEPVFENSFLCFMTYDDEHHRIAIAGIPGLEERPKNAVGVDHIAFTYTTLGDLVHTYERLADLGITPALPIHHGPTLSLYYDDPDRNRVELQIDVFDRREDQDAFFESAQFAQNPLGVIFDPAELARRFHDGVSEAELKQPLAGPSPDPEAFAPR